MFKPFNSSRGFTLIELMIVIAVVAVIAAVAIPNYMSARDKAKRVTSKQALDAYAKAENMYLADRGIYTPNLDDLKPYANITNLQNAYRELKPIEVNKGKGFTIWVLSNDRFSTPITATEEGLWCFRD